MKETELTLIADPKVLKIPIQENQDPLIDLIHQDEILYGPSPEIENNTQYTRMRKSVYDKLCHAQTLLPKEFRLCLYEGLRTVELQKLLFDERWKKIAGLKKDWSHEEIYNEVIKMVSPVVTFDGTPNIPPHSTGAAVDVYLVDSRTFNFVDMGILAKDWMQDPDGVLSKTYSHQISKEAIKNRQILFEVMTAVGFVNYPTEYWHWSYGDRYWAYCKEQPFALYGPVDSTWPNP